MVQFNTKDNEILVKIVYYGTGLSGKTTNLHMLHEMTDPKLKTDLFSVNTMEDRTLFFDLLPFDLGYVYGNSIKLQIYTVPGQVHYDSTRRIVLSGADGIVFVADSNHKKIQENVQSLNNLYHNLQANRLNIKEIPLILQYNKRDLPDTTPVDLLNQKLNFRNVPYFEAVAIRGEGVLQTFLETVMQTVRYIFDKYQLSKDKQNIDGILAKLEKSITVNAEKQRESSNNTLPGQTPAAKRHSSSGQTVLKYTHHHDPNNEKGAQDQLLQKALSSNMETAHLYTQLKKSQRALVQKSGELQALYKKLEKSNADNLKIRRFLESMVNFAGEAIMTFSDHWVIQNWNQAAEELFGYKRDAVLNQNIEILFSEDAMGDLNRVLEYVTSGKVVRGFETRLKSKRGAGVQVSITLSPIKNQKNAIIAFAAIVRDLSFVKKINQKLFSLQRFESICGLLPDLLARERNDNPGHQGNQGRDLQRLLELCDNPSASKQPTNINRILEELHQLIEPRLKRQNIGWTSQLFSSLPEIPLDRHQIQRALLNLFLNALDSIGDRPNGRITVGTHFAKKVLVQIIDNGAGLAQDELDNLFEAALNDKKSLMGIRLNVARDVVSSNQGNIRVDSAPGKGTKITLRFSA